MARVLVPMADGVEEIEAVIIIDTLRRAGWDVVSAGLHPGTITASRGVQLVPDTTWDAIDIDTFDIIALPGGASGAEALKTHPGVMAALRRHAASGKITAAICAAPLVLQEAGLLAGKSATCHPSLQNQLTSAEVQANRVVRDGVIITSQGPGTAFEFALTLVALVDGPQSADHLRSAMVLK